MRSEEFITKIDNFNGKYEELSELIHEYLYSKDEDSLYKIEFFRANLDKIQRLREETMLKRNSKLPFNYQNLYDFQYNSLLRFYFEHYNLIVNNQDKDLMHKLYKLHCEIFNCKEEFTENDFNSYKLDSPYCKFTIFEFLNEDSKIQPLCNKVFYPYNISGDKVTLYLPFTVEYNYDDKKWLCTYEIVDSNLQRANLILDVSKKSDEEIIDEILLTLNLYPVGGTA